MVGKVLEIFVIKVEDEEDEIGMEIIVVLLSNRG